MAQTFSTSLLSPLLQQFLKVGKIGCLSGIGVLSGGLAIAQTPQTDSPSVEIAPPIAAPRPAAPSIVIEPTVPAPKVETVAPAPVYKAPIAVPESYSAPETIIFSERSTGCKTFVKGRNFSDSCAPAPAPVVRRSGNVAGLSSPKRVDAIAPLLNGQASSQSYASGRSSGRGYTPTASFQNYYQRTYRPVGRIGNGNVRLIFPLAIPAPITSLFGWRVHPITGDSRFHAGVDMGAPLGTPVLAALAGQVAIADFLNGYGLTVTLQHANGKQETLYAHLSEIFVKPGDAVKQGDVIGRVGSTGLSTGPHLHFEFRQQTPDGWVALDPGAQLEYGLAELVRSMRAAEKPAPKTRG